MEGNYIEPQCAANSIGLANRLITTLVSTLLTLHCNISSTDMWPQDYGPIALTHGAETYDFVIVGAGSAGSVVASRLAEHPQFKVLLIEAGGNPPIESEIPGMSSSLQHTKYDWEYPTQSNGLSCLGMKHESCIWSKGKLLGGSSSINSMLYARGNPNDYYEWSDSGMPEWDWTHVLPFFKKSENFLGDNKFDVHGTGGLMTVDAFQATKYDQTLILQAAKELGFNQVDDFVDGNYIGFGFMYGTVEEGRRMSAAKAFLTDDKPNLHIIKNSVAKKIHFENTKKATSLSFMYDGKHEMNVKATREIILSAGAIETPKLLMLSGIGPKTHLDSLSIPVFNDLPVGENLKDHTMATIFVKFEYKYKLSPEMRLSDIIYKQWIHRTGKYGIERLDIGGFINTKLDSEFPDVQFLYTPVDNLTEFGQNYKSGIVESLQGQLNPGDYLMAINVMVLRPKSSGFVRLASTDYHDKPIILPNSFQKDSDMEAIIQGIRKQYDFVDTPSFQKHRAEILRPELAACDILRFKTRKYWECYVKHMTNSPFDAVGTAKMGHKRDFTAVVDPEMKVRGMKGLRVVDASIMPDIVSGNTNAPTIMIGERGSEFIIRTWT